MKAFLSAFVLVCLISVAASQILPMIGFSSEEQFSSEAVRLDTK